MAIWEKEMTSASLSLCVTFLTDQNTPCYKTGASSENTHYWHFIKSLRVASEITSCKVKAILAESYLCHKKPHDHSTHNSMLLVRPVRLFSYLVRLAGPNPAFSPPGPRWSLCTSHWLRDHSLFMSSTCMEGAAFIYQCR